LVFPPFFQRNYVNIGSKKEINQSFEKLKISSIMALKNANKATNV